MTLFIYSHIIKSREAIHIRKIILGIIIPLLTMVTLIGTGLATWYFADNTAATQTASVGVTVESYIELGNLQVSTNKVTLHLDQPKTQAMTDGAYLSQDIVITYTANNPNNVNTTGSVKGKLTIPTSIAKYLTLSSDWKQEPSSPGQDVVYTRISTFKQYHGVPIKINITNKIFSYNPNNVPKTKAEYDQLVNDCKNANIKLEVTAYLNK